MHLLWSMNLRTCQFPQYHNFPSRFLNHRHLVIQKIPSHNRLLQVPSALRGFAYLPTVSFPQVDFTREVSFMTERCDIYFSGVLHNKIICTAFDYCV